MKSDARVLIAGAGVAGLTAAIWLGRHGIRPLVIERASRIRADGFIISLSHDSYRFARELDLLPRLRELDARIAASSYHDRTGRALLTLDYQRLFGGVELIQVMRDDLQTALHEAARDVADFRFDSAVDQIEETDDATLVRFRDGTTEVFDAVIGADGVHSTVRRAAFSEDDIQRHWLGLNCAAYSVDGDVGLRAKFETHMERDRYLVIYASGNGRSAAVFVWESDSRDVPPKEQRFDAIRAQFQDPPAMVQRVFDVGPPKGSVYFDALQQIEMPRWHRGRVCLLGDAAHCMTLLSGQGASSAFAGASYLGKALIAMEPTDAFQSYEAAMRPMISEVQPMARRSASWYVPRSPWRQMVRDSAMRWLPESYFYRHFQSKYSKA